MSSRTNDGQEKIEVCEKLVIKTMDNLYWRQINAWQIADTCVAPRKKTVQEMLENSNGKS